MKREDIVAAAREWIGVKWQHQGRTRHGVDCVGLLVVTGSALGLDGYDWTDYPRRPDGRFVRHFKDVLKIKRVSAMDDGDVVIFSDGGHACHCGIMSTFRGAPAVIHSVVSRRKVVEESMTGVRDSVGPPMFCFEFPEVED